MPSSAYVRIEVTCLSCPLQIDVWITDDLGYPDERTTYYYYRARHGMWVLSTDVAVALAVSPVVTIGLTANVAAHITVGTGNDDGKDNIPLAIERVLDTHKRLR